MIEIPECGMYFHEFKLKIRSRRKNLFTILNKKFESLFGILDDITLMIDLNFSN